MKINSHKMKITINWDSSYWITTYSIRLIDVIIKDTFHVAMRSQRFFNMTPQSLLRAKFDRREPPDVVRVKEHKSDHSFLFMDSKRISSENDSLNNDTSRVGLKNISPRYDFGEIFKLFIWRDIIINDRVVWNELEILRISALRVRTAWGRH